MKFKIERKNEKVDFPFGNFRVLNIGIILNEFQTDTGGHHCPCPALPFFVFELIFQKIVSIFSARCLSVRISEKAARCVSVRPDKDETELSWLSLSLSVDVCFQSFEVQNLLGSSFQKFNPKTNKIYYVTYDMLNISLSKLWTKVRFWWL